MASRAVLCVFLFACLHVHAASSEADAITTTSAMVASSTKTIKASPLGANDQRALDTGVLAGIVFGAVILLAVTVLTILCCVRRHRQQRRRRRRLTWVKGLGHQNNIPRIAGTDREKIKLDTSKTGLTPYLVPQITFHAATPTTADLTRESLIHPRGVIYPPAPQTPPSTNGPVIFPIPKGRGHQYSPTRSSPLNPNRGRKVESVDSASSASGSERSWVSFDDDSSVYSQTTDSSMHSANAPPLERRQADLAEARMLLRAAESVGGEGRYPSFPPRSGDAGRGPEPGSQVSEGMWLKGLQSNNPYRNMMLADSDPPPPRYESH